MSATICDFRSPVLQLGCGQGRIRVDPSLRGFTSRPLILLCAFYGSVSWVPPLLVKVMLFFSGLTFQSLLNPLPEPLELLVPSTFVLGFQLSGTALFDFVLLRLLSIVPPRTLARALSGLFTLRPLFLVGSASRFVVLDTSLGVLLFQVLDVLGELRLLTRPLPALPPFTFFSHSAPTSSSTASPLEGISACPPRRSR